MLDLFPARFLQQIREPGDYYHGYEWRSICRNMLSIEHSVWINLQGLQWSIANSENRGFSIHNSPTSRGGWARAPGLKGVLGHV